MNSSAEIPKVEDLDAEQAELVEQILSLRATLETDPGAKRNLRRATGKLDGLYWRRVRALLDQRLAAGRETLAFSPEERLVIDMGLLDIRLVENADDGLRDRLLAELDVSGSPNHYYFSEWLEDRYRRYLLTRQMADADARDEEEDSELARLAEARDRIYGKLRPRFEGLPGVSEEIAASVTSGKLEDQIQAMGVTLLDRHERPLFLRRHGLRNLRLQVIGKLRARVKDEREIRLCDMLDVIYGKMWAERFKIYEAGGAQENAATDSEVLAGRRKLLEYLDGEIKFVKSLLPLGALAGGVARSCAALLSDRPRITKAATRRELQRARQCDRDFTADPVVLIAPFEGRGIFEWDHDSLVVPLTPVHSPEDAIANATGNYRMLIDSFQQDGALKTAYEETFSGANFQQAFLSDYRDWLCRAGHGRRDGLEEEHYAFFREHVGPDADGVLAPANLRNLGEEARNALRTRLEKLVSIGSADPQAHHRLGALCWRDGELQDAAAYLSKCVARDHDNGMALFSLGLVLRALGRGEQAQRAFGLCRERTPESIWALYAAEQLDSGEAEA